MATSNVVISEGQITFKGVQGHKHDGILSTLIDTSKYSIFDFIVAENAKDPSRASSQANRKEMLKSFIISTVEDRVLKPTGIALQANSITAREIVSGTITADELSSNIILVNNIIRSSNYINNTGTYSGWAIFSNGTANFNSVNIRGNIYLSSTGGMSYNSNSTAFFANSAGYFSLKDKLTWDGSNLTITGNATISGTVTIAGTAAEQIATKSALGGTSLQPGAAAADVNTYNTVISGDKIRTGSISSQNGINVINLSAGTINFGSGNFTVDSSGNVVVAGTITATDGYIGGLDIATTYIQSTDYIANPTTAGFRINSDGTAIFNEITVRGTVYAGAGEIGGWLISGDDIVSPLTDGQSVVISPTNGIFSRRYVGGTWGSGLFTEVKINYGTFGSGIDVTGDASGTTETTEIRSSTISSKYITATTQLRADGSVGVGTSINESQNSSVGAYGVYIDNSGFLTATRAGLCLVLNQTTTGTASQQVAEFRRRGSQPGTSGIFVSSTAVAYATTSDYRLKKDIIPIEDSIGLIKILNPVSFNWINHESLNKTYGFLAHELQEVVPDAVMNEKDGVDEDGNPKYQSVDVSFTVPIIVSALKEAIAKIEELEARIQTLEGV